MGLNLTSAALLAILVASGPSTAQITVIAPFTGIYTEEFETLSYSACVPGRIFKGHGDVCTPGHSGCLVTSSWLIYVGYIMYTHNASNGFFGTTLGYANMVFDTPVQRFGGYFGTPGYLAGGIAKFYDSGNGLLATLPITAPRGAWAWNGWDAGLGAKIKRVEMFANDPYNGGALICIDDAEIDPYTGLQYFGSSCSGSLGNPTLRVTGALGLGNTLTFTVTNSAAPLAQLWLGFSTTTWNGLNLPLDLALIGVPSCFVNVSLEALIYSGALTPLQVPIPVLPVLLGATSYWQCALLNDPSNKLVVMTKGAAITLW